MKVTAVGDNTEIGHVSKETTKNTEVPTPLNNQLNRLAKVISKVSCAIAVLIFIICAVHGIYNYFSLLPPGQPVDWIKIGGMCLNYFMIAVTLIVMAVPEGLPMAVTLSLSLNMRRMLSNNILVRKMHAGETMGAITVICTDKTGTLTQNSMKVEDVYGQTDDKLINNMAVNSTALLNADGTSSGNPTESALLRYIGTQGKDYLELRAQAKIISQMPFSTEKKMMGTLVDDNGNHILFVKGAPEYIMELCDMTAEQQADANAQLEKYQNAAMRTLAFAYTFSRETDIETILAQKHFTFQGKMYPMLSGHAAMRI